MEIQVTASPFVRPSLKVFLFFRHWLQESSLKKHGAGEEGSTERGNAHGELASTAGDDVAALGGLGGVAGGAAAVVVVEGAVDGERGRAGGGGGGRDGAQSGGSRRARLGANVLGSRGTGEDLDALPGAALVAVDVALGAGGVVLHRDGLVVRVEGRLLKVGQPARPVDGALLRAAPAADPVAELDLHRRLRVRQAAVRLGRCERADHGPVHRPLDPLARPVERVRVELANWVGDRVVAAGSRSP